MSSIILPSNLPEQHYLEDTVSPGYHLDCISLTRQPPGMRVTSFGDFITTGFIRRRSNVSLQPPRSSSKTRMIPFIFVPPLGQNGMLNPITTQHPIQPRETVNRAGLVCVTYEDAWKIGDMGDHWQEPLGTSVSDYDLWVLETPDVWIPAEKSVASPFSRRELSLGIDSHWEGGR
jgi:hypothetical protein